MKPRGLIVMLVAAGAVCARAAERQIDLEPSAKQVKRCEKIEFLLRVGARAENPYDPNDIALEIHLTAPSGKPITVPAFHYQHFERQRLERGRERGEWLYPVGDPAWKARFAPAEVGVYSAEARLKDRQGEARSGRITFESLPSESRGFVRISRHDPRFLELDDGRAFFAVGQNAAFVRDVYETEAILHKMAQQGANYARVWACCEDWAMAVEARKSAWGRSWAWNPPIVAVPGREGYHSDEKCVRIAGEAGVSVEVSPTRRLALRPATAYRLSGAIRADQGVGVSLDIGGVKESKTIAAGRNWTGFQHEFTSAPDQWWLSRLSFRLTAKGTAWLRELSLREAKGGPELLDEADVNRPVRGSYNQPDCFMLDKLIEAAEQNGLRLQLVLLTRDHYMDLLRNENSRDYDEAIAAAKRLLRYAVARWGYSTAVAAWEYFNEMNPGLPTDRFYSELGEYLEQTDPYRHLRATSTWGPSKKDWLHPKLDSGDTHWYLRPAEAALYKDEVEAVVRRARLLRDGCPAKPALFSEFGLTNDQWQRDGRADADKEYVHLHNALWTSALSGLSGAVLPWFWEDIERKDMYHHYRPLAAFVADVPFTTASLRSSAVACSDKNLRVFCLQGKTCAYLWVFNPQATWHNLSVEKATPAPIAGASLVIDGLQPGAYDVQWWDTWKGAIFARDKTQAAEATLGLKIPAFSRDIAARVARLP